MKRFVTVSVVATILAALTNVGFAGGKAIKRGIYYGPENATEYQKEMCKLDLYLPADEYKKFPVVISFHGGGLTGGKRGGPNLTSMGVATVAPSYRLAPKAKCPDYINDAADAIAWTFKNIEKYGGDPERIFISGGSAGSYLASLVTMDKSWLENRGIDIDRIAGLIPVSGHMITHFTVRSERKIAASCGLSDKYSPLFHIRKTPFPIFIQCGDNDYPGRQEENKLFIAMMIKYAGQDEKKIIYKEYPGTHGTFGRNPEKGRDFARFVLETSGMAEPSGMFGGEDEIGFNLRKAVKRSFGKKSFLEFDSELSPGTSMKVVSSGGQVTCMNREKPLRLSKDKKYVDVTLNKKVMLTPFKNTGEYTVTPGKAVELSMKGGSQLKVSASGGNLEIELAAKDASVVAPTGKPWTGDAIEIFIDRTPFSGLSDNAYPAPGKNVEVLQYVFAAKPLEAEKYVLLKNHSEENSKAVSKTEMTGSGYRLAVSIPLAEITPLDNSEKVIAINFQRCVKDEKSKLGKEHFLADRPSHVERLHYPLFKIEDF